MKEGRTTVGLGATDNSGQILHVHILPEFGCSLLGRAVAVIRKREPRTAIRGPWIARVSSSGNTPSIATLDNLMYRAWESWICVSPNVSKCPRRGDRDLTNTNLNANQAGRRRALTSLSVTVVLTVFVAAVVGGCKEKGVGCSRYLSVWFISQSIPTYGPGIVGTSMVGTWIVNSD